ncbi:MAG: L,D-transpeptidase [bacterium]
MKTTRIVLLAVLILLGVGSSILLFAPQVPPGVVKMAPGAPEGSKPLPAPPQDPKVLTKEISSLKKKLAQMSPKGLYIVIDTHSNFLYLRKNNEVLLKAVCSTGYGGELVDTATGRKWVFKTPVGVYKVTSKLRDPWWRKPDWAFIEEGSPLPKNEHERYDANMLGDFALGFGKGYFIHGTLYTRLLGVAVSHGCVRVGDEDLKFLFQKVSVGTPVYVF